MKPVAGDPAGHGLPITVEVAYALPARQVLLSLQVPAGTTARQAVKLSGIASEFDELDPASADLGVFGKAVEDDHVLLQGDRVEIYRPLIADPKAVRRARAAKTEESKRPPRQ